MALIRALSSAGGGGIDPDSGELIYSSAGTSTLAAGTLNLTSGKKISDYSYLNFVWRVSTSDSTSAEILISVPQFQNMPTGGTHAQLTLSGYISGSMYWRRLAYNNDTSITIGQGNNGSGTQSNGTMIPTAIYGIK